MKMPPKTHSATTPIKIGTRVNMTLFMVKLSRVLATDPEVMSDRNGIICHTD